MLKGQECERIIKNSTEKIRKRGNTAFSGMKTLPIKGKQRKVKNNFKKASKIKRKMKGKNQSITSDPQKKENMIVI